MRLRKGVKLIAHGVAIICALNEESLQFCKSFGGRQAGGGIDLDTVAGGKDHRLFRDARLAQQTQRGRNLRRSNGKALPDDDRGRVVAQTYDNQRHGSSGIGPRMMKTGKHKNPPEGKHQENKSPNRA